MRLTAIIQDKRLFRRKPDIVLRAIELAWAYRHGKPRQQVEMTGLDNNTRQFDLLTVLTAAGEHAKSWMVKSALPPRRIEKYRAATSQGDTNSPGTVESHITSATVTMA